MNQNSFGKRFKRAAVAMMVGGSAFQISGCDPDVRDALLVGLEGTTQSLADALITAYFLSLDNNDGGVTTTG